MKEASQVAGHVPSELQALNRNFAVVAFGADGRVVRANNLFLRIFGYELDEVIGQGLSLFALPAAEQTGNGRCKVRLPIGRRSVVTSRGFRKDGSEIWIESHFATMTDDEGDVTETVAIVSDVTEQRLQASDEHGQMEAIQRSQAVAHFALDGTLLGANNHFLNAVGYTREEVVGRHHRVFVEPSEAESSGYAEFWAKLAQGCHHAAEYRRVAKDGHQVRLQASYNPIFDPTGRPVRIVHYAVDVTAERRRQAEYEWQIAAIQKSQAVISFDMHGVILDANDNFLAAMGYRLEEIVGRHHRMFVEASYAHSAEYMHFWRDLKKGLHRSGQYKRVGRNGSEVWLQATYNPIFDMDGRPIRVVKYATVVTEDKLQQADHEGQIAAIHKSQCVISFDMQGVIIDANDNFLDITGYRYADILGRHHHIFVDDGEAACPEYRDFWDRLAAGEHCSGEFKRIRSDGREIWLQASYNPVFDLNGQPFKVVKYATDITAEKLRQADHAGQIDAIGKSQGVITMSLDGTIMDANETVLASFGYAFGEMVGHHHSLLVEPGYAQTAEYRQLWEQLRAGSFHRGMYKRIGKNGREIWLQATYNPILDLNGRPYKIVKFATDVTANVEMAAAFEDAKRQAQHDAATSLPNRVRLASFLAAAMPHSGRRLAIFYVDLDRFKPINDTFGHHVGDRVLGEIADRFRRILTDDQIVARVGGDEFVIAAPDLSEDEIEAMGRRIVELVAMPIHNENGDLRVSASIGIAVAPSDGTTPDDLLRCADAALYRSKRNGRGTYSFYASEMNARIMADRKLTAEMRRAITTGEFFLEYQPRFDTSTKAVRSVEALVRWAHPERGRIAPGEFIPLAERSGLIVPLGSWILATACRMAATIPTIGVSVNVSPVQFRSGDLVATVEAALREAALPAEKLELEITEGVLLEDADRARSTLERLKSLGVKLAIDDFGTGYSSMSYLCDYPFDVIKIDRKFISDIDGTGSGKAVVQAILGLGRALGLRITAEGVETEGQLAALTSERCDEIQGYLLSRPLPPEELARTIEGAGHVVQPLAA